MIIRPEDRRRRLSREHTPEAIRSRLGRPPETSYLRDFIYGAIDGAITTFAIVAGSSGAVLGEGVVVVLGLANLFADGFSMAVSNFLGIRAARDERDQARAEEERQIELVPEGEREEVRQIYAAKGFEGDDLEHVVEVITSDRDRWVETMMSEELGYGVDIESPLKAAAATFSAFILVGAVPLLAYIVNWLFDDLISDPFLVSGVLTALAFVGVGIGKSAVVRQPRWKGALQTLALGGAAAGVAYLVGLALRGVG